MLFAQNFIHISQKQGVKAKHSFGWNATLRFLPDRWSPQISFSKHSNLSINMWYYMYVTILTGCIIYTLLQVEISNKNSKLLA